MEGCACLAALAVFGADSTTLVPDSPTSRKGDAEDREKLRKKADEERKNKQRQMLLYSLEDEVFAQFKLVGG